MRLRNRQRLLTLAAGAGRPPTGPRRRPSIAVSVILLTGLACSLLPSDPASLTPLPTSAPPSLSATAPAEARSVASPAPAATARVNVPATSEPATLASSSTAPPTTEPTSTEPATETYIAYSQNNAVFVTHVIGGQALDTRQITDSKPNEWVMDISWSPSGEFLAYVLYMNSNLHLFYVNVLKPGTPVDLGIAQEDFAWSPDSKQLAFGYEYELWVVSVLNGRPRHLTNHLGGDWLWGKLAFSPAGDALVAVGADVSEWRQKGYLRFKLFRVPLDGSAANSYPSMDMPSLTEEMTGHMPLALSFSPSGQKLALAAWVRIDDCAKMTTYYVGNADGSDLRALPVASLAALDRPDERKYFFGDSLVWTPDSEGLWVKGLIKDCDSNFRIVAGPQVSHVTLDGQEHEIIPGAFSEYGKLPFSALSLDRTGTLLGVLNTSGAKPRVQILGRDGLLVLDLGEGEFAVLQP